MSLTLKLAHLCPLLLKFIQMVVFHSKEVTQGCVTGRRNSPPLHLMELVSQQPLGAGSFGKHITHLQNGRMTFRFTKWSDSQDGYKDDILGTMGRWPGATVSIETQGSTNARGFPTITTSRCGLLDLVTLLSLTWSQGTQAWDTGFFWVLEPV